MRLLRVSYLTTLCHGAFAWKPASDCEPDTEPPRLRTTATSPTSREYTHDVAATIAATATPPRAMAEDRPRMLLAACCRSDSDAWPWPMLRGFTLDTWPARTAAAMRMMNAMTS